MRLLWLLQKGYLFFSLLEWNEINKRQLEDVVWPIPYSPIGFGVNLWGNKICFAIDKYFFLSNIPLVANPSLRYVIVCFLDSSHQNHSIIYSY